MLFIERREKKCFSSGKPERVEDQSKGGCDELVEMVQPFLDGAPLEGLELLGLCARRRVTRSPGYDQTSRSRRPARHHRHSQRHRNPVVVHRQSRQRRWKQGTWWIGSGALANGVGFAGGPQVAQKFKGIGVE